MRNGSRVRREIGTLAGLLLLCIALWIATPYFGTTSNLVNVIQQSTIIGIVAAGMTFVIITGGIDLSVGSIVGFTAYMVGTLLSQNNEIHPVAVVLMAITVVSILLVERLRLRRGGWF